MKSVIKAVLQLCGIVFLFCQNTENRGEDGENEGRWGIFNTDIFGEKKV